MFDEQGRLIKGAGIIYDPALPGVWMADRARFHAWMARHRAAGSTHLAIGGFEPGPIYPGSEFDNPDMVNDPALFRAFIEELVTTPAADGQGFRLVLQLDGGGPNPRPRILATWRRLLDAIADYLRSCIVSAVWEIGACDWRSADYNFAVLWLADYRQRLPVEQRFLIGLHPAPGRCAWTSNPIQADDPLQGEESASLSASISPFPQFNGERLCGPHIDTLLFQAIPPDPRDDMSQCVITIVGIQLVCAQHGTDCWLDRVWDWLYRPVAGNNGWRKLPGTLLEDVAWPTWHAGAMAARLRGLGSKVLLSKETGKPVFEVPRDGTNPHERRLKAALVQAQASHVARVLAAAAGSASTLPFATQAANAVRDLADRLGVSIGFGNGLPSQEAQ